MKSLLIVFSYLGLTALAILIWGDIAGIISLILVSILFMFCMAKILDLD